MAPTEYQTHYVPAFTVRRHEAEQAACGRFVTRAELAPRDTYPTCPECQRFLGVTQEQHHGDHTTADRG